MIHSDGIPICSERVSTNVPGAKKKQKKIKIQSSSDD